MKRFFHSELETLKSHLMLMGEKACEATQKSITALLEADVELASSVIREDDAIDDLEIEIDHEATRYLTLRAPVAADLRLITIAIKASHDLERVGDEARTAAKRTRKLILREGTPGELLRIPEMAQIAIGMLRDAVQCFLNEEHAIAHAILERDEEVDRLNKENIKGFIQLAKNTPESIERSLDLIFISKSLERIADHATNLAEEIIFLTTAQDTRHKRDN